MEEGEQMNQTVSSITNNGQSVVTLDDFVIKIEGKHLQVFERGWKGNKKIFDSEEKAL
jgi:hypothetical protein